MQNVKEIKEISPCQGVLKSSITKHYLSKETRES